MKEIDLFKEAKKIANYLFQTSELKISRSEYQNLIGRDFDDYSEIIINSLSSINKIGKRQGRTGGLEYIPAQKRQPVLTDNDTKNLKENIQKFYKIHNSKRTYNRPEANIEKAFKEWLIKEKGTIDRIINFRSSSRKNGKWKNVDGYEIFPITLSYFFEFIPILITYEVKAGVPSKKDIAQASEYLKFSHQVYLVFKDDRTQDKLWKYFRENDIIQQDAKLGIYVTNDEKRFFQMKQPIHQTPSNQLIDESIENLLSEDDKEKLLNMKYRYLQGNIIKLLSD